MKPKGRCSAAFAFMKSSASPTVRPGNGTPWMVAELSCWNVVSVLGCTDCSMETTLASGTSAPELVRT